MNFKALESAQKLRGGYYTPEPIAAFLSRWALAGGARRVLEPSCGDGVFFSTLGASIAEANLWPGIVVDAVEIVPEEAGKADHRADGLRAAGAEVKIANEDFFRWLERAGAGRQWDAVIGNPPYIRYQYFDEDQRNWAELTFRRAGIPFSKRTNAWVPFVIASVEHLSPGGRLAMVIPAELLHVAHADGLRRLLEREMEQITVINLREMVFAGALQGIILLLAVKRRHAPAVQFVRQPQLSLFPAELCEESTALQIIEIDRADDLLHIDLALNHRTSVTTSTQGLDGNWMLAVLAPEERHLVARLNQHPSVERFAQIADVDIGIVTGANDFFVVDQQTVNRYELQTIAFPMLAKSNLIGGITYTAQDHAANAQAGKAVYLLRFPKKPFAELPAKMAEYIRLGETRSLHTRFKCRIREPWYVVPYVWVSEVAMLKRSHKYPRLVLNEFGAYSTDTAYRIRMRPECSTRARDLTFSFMNSLTFLSAELEGRHYGGGVLEMVPSEIERLLIPLGRMEAQELAEVDAMVRRRMDVDELLQVTDPLILQNGLGLSPIETAILQTAHRRLRDRRLRVK
ncbi:MAG: class I SAM-dependent methyltransferase [Anaerolineae bacterium]